jgi:hypothetical protein
MLTRYPEHSRIHVRNHFQKLDDRQAGLVPHLKRLDDVCAGRILEGSKGKSNDGQAETQL